MANDIGQSSFSYFLRDARRARNVNDGNVRSNTFSLEVFLGNFGEEKTNDREMHSLFLFDGEPMMPP